MANVINNLAQLSSSLPVTEDNVIISGTENIPPVAQSTFCSFS